MLEKRKYITGVMCDYNINNGTMFVIITYIADVYIAIAKTYEFEMFLKFEYLLKLFNY